MNKVSIPLWITALLLGIIIMVPAPRREPNNPLPVLPLMEAPPAPPAAPEVKPEVVPPKPEEKHQPFNRNRRLFPRNSPQCQP